MRASLKINEIFFSIQGESLFVGKPTVFVRTTGCPLRCTWCDTEYAFHEGRRMSVSEILAQVARHPTRFVCVTGGEPLAQPGTLDLLTELVAKGYTVSLETSGALSVKDVPAEVIRIIDLKCPGSGESARMDWTNLDRLRPQDQLKAVVASREDFAWATALVRQHRLAERATVLFSPVHGKVSPADLAQWVLAEGLPVTMQLQLHKILWGADARGV